MPLALIFNANSPSQSADGSLDSFDSQGNTQDQDFVRGDINLAISLRPVVPSVTTSRPWDDDHISTDTYEVGIGNPDIAPTGGDYPLGIFAATIQNVEALAVATIETAEDHNLISGDAVIIVGCSDPLVNGIHPVTVLGSDSFSIPVVISGPASGGTVYDAEGLEDVAFDQSAPSLETIISALSIKHDFPAIDVELLAAGVYQLTWDTNGAVPSLYSPANNDLTPDSAVAILVDSAGDSDTQAIQIISLRQQPVAFSQPSTQFATAAVTATVFQAGNSSPAANKIYKITLTPNTYAGTYSITLTTVESVIKTIGVVAYSISADDLLAQLVAASGLAETDFRVTRDNDVVTIELAGTQGNSNTPVIAVTNVDLLAPKGVSGLISLNTTSLFRAFALTTESTLDFTLAVRRTRVSGEEAEIFQHAVTLKRSLIDALTMVPVSLPTYLTEAQSDARYAKIEIEDVRKLLDDGTIQIASPNGTFWKLTVDNSGVGGFDLA